MKAHNKTLTQLRVNPLFVFIGGIFIALLFCGGQASAVNGADSNVFPDTSYPAGSTTYSVVQLRTGGAQVRARSTVANVYVPVSMGGQTVDLVIFDGCNNSGPDINGWIANTSFYMEYPYIAGSERNTATHCSGGNISLQFQAVTTHSDGRAVRRVSDGTGSYYVYRFKADAYGSELTQYLNAFQIWGATPGLYIGPSDTPSQCDNASYPRSCPSPRRGAPYEGISIVYSSYYNRTNPSYGQRLQVRTGNCSNVGRISLYDLDANDAALNQNLYMEIRANGALVSSLNHAQISAWELYRAPDGSLPHVGIYGGNEDQFMDLPAIGTFTMIANTDYELIITGISPNNAMQAAILTYQEGICDEPKDDIPGCTNSTAPNFNPMATVDDGSCDFCANITGAQNGLPPGLVQDGPNCVFPPPTCTPAPAIAVFTGQEFTTSITLTNNSTATLDVVSINYVGPNGITGISNSGGQDVGPTPASITQSATGTRNNPLSGTITWTITYGQTANISGNGTVTCEQAIRIRNRPPVCRVLPIDPLSPQVGEPFRTRVIITNPNPNAINLTSAGYQLQNIPSDSRNTNTTGQATASMPQSLATGVDGTQLESAQDIRVYRQALGFDVIWTIVAEDADPGTCNRAGNNESLFDIILLPPVCTVGRKDIVVGVPFDISVSLTNPNNFVSLQLRNSGEEYVVSNGRSGDADPEGGWDPASGNTTVMMNREIGFTSIASDLTVDNAGDYSINWSIDSEAGLAVGDCADLGAPGSPGGPGGGGSDGGGPGDPTLSAYTQPYVRFYGNDVFAGGNYGATCTQSGDPRASGNGYFSSSPNTHAVYRGAASELAIFALDEISGVLAGSQDTTRPALNSLSFANLGAGAGGSQFGGDFASPLCADDYWGFRPDNSDDFAILPASGTALPRIDLATMPSGVFTYDGDVHVFASSPIADGTRITLYVAGTTWIGDSNYSGASGQAISYDTSDAWATIDDIPFVRIITKGNIHIDNNMDSLDGMYVAIPDESPSAVQPTGEIYTCGLSDQLLILGNPATSDTVANCNRKLTVTGAFMAKRVHLLRTFGNVGSAPVAPELYNSANIGEVFRFSPELYLAMISGGYGSAVGQFDSIKTLPPAL